MALVLIKEDGTGRVDANTYAEVADGDAYHEGHLYAGPWTGATEENKGKALVMATRLLDMQFEFKGWRAHGEQALEWPRRSAECGGRSLLSAEWGVRGGEFGWEGDGVPRGVVAATCELARELLVQDRTAPAPGEGVASTVTGAGETFSSVKYCKEDTRPVIPLPVQVMLARYGDVRSARSGTVRVVRT